MKRYLASLLLLPLVALAGWTGAAHALVWSDFGAGVNPFSSGWSSSGWSAEDMFAAARIGNASVGTPSSFDPWELAVGRDRISGFHSAQVGWQNHRDYAFELAFDGTLARWSVDDHLGRRVSVGFSPIDAADINAVAFRVAAHPGASDALTLDNLSLNGEDVASGSVSWAPGSGDGSYRWWGLSGAGSLSRGFTLAGNIRWDLGSTSGRMRPSGLELEVHGANLPQTPPVPEPGTLALLGSGMLSLGGALIRKRPHRQ